jgi:hypothetical protein
MGISQEPLPVRSLLFEQCHHRVDRNSEIVEQAGSLTNRFIGRVTLSPVFNSFGHVSTL